MKNIQCKSPAKVSLYHSIVFPKIDNYWSIQAVILPIDLYDIIEVKLNPFHRKVKFNSNSPMINSNNLCIRASKLFLNEINEDIGVEIDLLKQIPVSSGLGGGSSNATITLKALNKLFDYPLINNTIKELAYSLSMDSFFFFHSKPGFLSGISNEFISFDNVSDNLRIFIIEPNVHFIDNKTEQIMKQVKTALNPSDYIYENYKLLLNNGIAKDIRENMYSFVTRSITQKYSAVFELQQQIKNIFNLNTVITGSGPYLVLPYDDSDTSIEMLSNYLFQKQIKFWNQNIIRYEKKYNTY